jgi:thiamine biosynthesis lipoprotein
VAVRFLALKTQNVIYEADMATSLTVLRAVLRGMADQIVHPDVVPVPHYRAAHATQRGAARIVSASPGLVLALACLAGPVAAQERHEFTAVHMGVPVRIVAYASADGVARDAARAAYARIAELDAVMSDYRPRSEVRLLSGRPRDWQVVSEDLLHVIVRAQEVSRWSGGAFDVTVGPLVQLWRQSRQSGRLPDAETLARARARSGATLLQVDTVRSSVRLKADSMQLDLGGIAKGYVLQEALTALRQHGIPAAMVEAGGDLVVGEAPPGRAGWSVEIAGADSAMREYAQALVNVAVATSGGSEQHVKIGGMRYSHVIDPRTGLGVTATHLVTVVARDGALADAVATALSVMGPGEAASRGRWQPDVLHVVWSTSLQARD